MSLCELIVYRCMYLTCVLQSCVCLHVYLQYCLFVCVCVCVYTRAVADLAQNYCKGKETCVRIAHNRRMCTCVCVHVYVLT